jgi:hypothetical protein
MSSAAWQEIRVGMTKERAMIRWKGVTGQKAFSLPWTGRRVCERTERKPQIPPLCSRLTRGVKPRDLIRVHFFANLEHEMSGCFF